MRRVPERVLLISFAYPPVSAPEALLSAKAVRSLAPAEVDVVCARPGRWQRQDPDMVGYAESAARLVHRVRQPWWVPVVQPVRAARRFPDALRFTVRRAVDAAERLEPDGYDALVTWSQWHSAHLVGLALKAAHPDLPWIAHFSDPWVDNPLIPVRGPGAAGSARMERAVVQAADALEFTSAETRSLVLRKYADDAVDRAHVVPHLFDETLYPSAPARSGEQLFVRHLGSFYGRRQPDPLLDALRRLVADDPSTAARLRVELIGPAPDASRAGGLPPGLVTYRDAVGYHESLRLMVEADLLVLIDAPAEVNVFLPSKLVDYIGAGRPILGLTPPGKARELVLGLGGAVASPDRPDDVDAALRSALSLAGTRPSTWGTPSVREAYGADAVGAQRRAILEDVIRSS